MFDFLLHRRRSGEGRGDEEAPEELWPPVEGQNLLFNPLGRLADAVKSGGHEAARWIEPRSEDDAREILSQTAVLAFVGGSGTGKSTRAIKLARENGISYMIDDGILIHGSNIIAGTSAKRAPTKIESVRQAIFADETRAQTMRRALLDEQPRALMILGTSRDMVDRICQNLWLAKPSMLIRIEDITSEEERRLARQTRLSEGTHTIPVPSMEIRHEFSGSLVEPLMKLRRRLDRAGKERGSGLVDSERTVVRPTFSTLGSYSISDDAMAQMVEIILRRIPGIAEMRRFRVNKEPYGASLAIDVSLCYGYDARKLLREGQRQVNREVERLSSINLLRVDITAVHLVKSAKYCTPAAKTVK